MNSIKPNGSLPIIIVIALLNFASCYGDDIKNEIRVYYDKQRADLEATWQYQRREAIGTSSHFDELFATMDSLLCVIEELDTTEAEFWSAAARGYYNFGDYKTARGYYESYFALGGDDPGVKYEYAFTFVKQEDYDTAIRIYREILTKTPDDFRTMDMLGKVLFFKERYAEALPCFEAILKTGEFELVLSNITEIYSNLMNCYYNTGQPQKVIDMVSEENDESDWLKSSNNIGILCAIAKAYWGVGNYKEAYEYCDKVLAIDPRNRFCSDMHKRR